jgi:aryl-alcohol dehydrogenase-like predicted oxidoreductase
MLFRTPSLGSLVQKKLDSPRWRGTPQYASIRWMDRSCCALSPVDAVQVAQKEGVSLGALSLAWCQNQAGVASTIIGATTMTQLKENLEAFDLKLSEECYKAVDEIYKARKDPSTIE